MILFLKSCKGTKTALGSKKEVVQNSYIFYAHMTQVSGWVIFTCRFRLLLVDSTFPQIVQVVFPSCTAWWFDKLFGLSNLLSH